MIALWLALAKETKIICRLQKIYTFIKTRNVSFSSRRTKETTLKICVRFRSRLDVLCFCFINRPYSKMAADLILFCMRINWPLWPRFRLKLILNFFHDNEVIRDNLYAYKRMLNRNKVQCEYKTTCKLLVHLHIHFRQEKTRWSSKFCPRIFTFLLSIWLTKEISAHRLLILNFYFYKISL